ncbi:MAG TPA: hypothetical protein VGI43_18105 [Mucilaginibacter sp.]
MRVLWCWKCKMNVPMLDDEEFGKAKELYDLGLKSTSPDRFTALLDYYNELTGFGETEAEEIMHHQISQYGPICENCGKPYRTQTSTFCTACGNRRK